MQKIRPHNYSGNDYVQLSKLPFNQITPFCTWLSDLDKTVLRDNSGEEHEFVNYELYEFWFDTIRDDEEKPTYSFF
jgi:hypothetical protein